MANAAAGLVEVALADTRPADTGPADTGQAHNDAAGQPARPTGSAQGEAPLIDDLLVEEISIDGMCGVY
jgi:mycofactocin precursor